MEIDIFYIVPVSHEGVVEGYDAKNKIIGF